jgi:hypothetical protein
MLYRPSPSESLSHSWDDKREDERARQDEMRFEQ